jgi:HEPN domain-containing protein
MEIAPAVVRLYARWTEIACEVEQAIDDGERVEVLLARSNRQLRAAHRFLRTGELDPASEAAVEADEAASARIRAAALAQHREYQWTKRELGRLLGLGPEDVNPLDLDPEREDGADAAARRRAIELRAQLNKELICWWRRGSQFCGDLAVIGPDDAAAQARRR